LSRFHFLFTGGTFKRILLERRLPGREIIPIKDDVQNFIIEKCGVTVLPDQREGGIIILANLIVQHQCGIIWPFLSPVTMHWLHPENLALIRLCDLWNVKKSTTPEAVRAWCRKEAKRDVDRNRQEIDPLTIILGSPEKDGKWPRSKPKYKNDKKYQCVEIPPRGGSEDSNKKSKGSKVRFKKQTIALIAHDAMKPRMVDFAIQYEDELNKFRRILATGTTGQEVENACRRLREGDKIRRCLSGPKGGDIEIATEILFGRCNIVLFFIDPLNPHPHLDDIRTVFSACMAEIENNDVLMITNEVHAREWIEENVRRR
jgi:methylglyoxal synthase